MKRVLVRARKIWARFEAPVLLIGGTASFLIWVYSNFATANEVSTSKAELRAYVDQRHGEVKNELEGIKDELRQQRSLQEQILLRVSN